MIECMRLIIGEVGTREREREGLKIGRSGRSCEIQNDLGGREGTAMLGTKMEAAALLLTPPTPKGLAH